MKKSCILWMSIWLTALMGCSGETYVGELPDNIDDNLGEPIPIVLGLGVPSYDILTRGSGPFENTIDDNMRDLWENAAFYVYAFNKDPNTDLTTTWSEANEDACLLDGNRSLRDQHSGGKETRVNIDNTSLMPFWPDEDELKVYYNTKHTELPYNFFAYYLDDSPATIHREKDRIYFDVEVDGRRDFMLSLAEPTDDQIKKLDNNPRKQKVLETTYSAYSANRGMNPVFRFKHQLVRFKFVIYSGETDKNKVPDIVLKGIDLMAMVKGKFTVAVNDPFSGESEYKLGLAFDKFDENGVPIPPIPLALREIDNTDLDAKGGYRVAWRDEIVDDIYKKTSVSVGGSLLVPSESCYQMKVHLVGDGETEGEPLEYDLYPPSPSTMFEAGKLYVVRIAIYSLSKIDVGVNAGKWGEGGDATLDT